MGGSREDHAYEELDHYAGVQEQRLHVGVMIPLVNYVRRNKLAADEFVLQKFRDPEYRVFALGETHFGPEVPRDPRDENVCVRLFFRDLVRRLYEDRSSTRLAYVALEIDEGWYSRSEAEGGIGPPEDMELPEGVVNRKAYWLAHCGSNRNNLAYNEALLDLSRTCNEDHVRFVGIDDRSRIRPDIDVVSFLNAGDIEQETGESDEDFLRRRGGVLAERGAMFQERERSIARNFRTRVLDHLGEGDRALIFYGGDHFAERSIEPEEAYLNLGRRTFVQMLAGTGGGPDAAETVHLPASAIYTMTTAYEGQPGPASIRLLGGEEPPDDLGFDPRMQEGQVALDQTVLRIYDVLRAEFTDDLSIGFDIDDAESHSIVLHLGGNNFGEAYDGYLFFRDLNRWAPGVDYRYFRDREGERSDYFSVRMDPPPLRITRVVPYTSYPGNRIFLYGYVFTEDVTVRIGGVESPGVTLINENLLAAEVPDSEAGEPVNVTVRRQVISRTDAMLASGSGGSRGDPLLDAAIGDDEPATETQLAQLRSCFRFRARPPVPAGEAGEAD